MAFDSTEQRDDHGRWVAGAGSGEHEAGPAMHVSEAGHAAEADATAREAAKVAEKLGFDPKLIDVRDEVKTFDLNGKTLTYGGYAVINSKDPNFGRITVYSHVAPDRVAGVVAHEIEHQKFQAFINDKRADEKRMETDPDRDKRSVWVRDPTGNSRITHDGPDGRYPVVREGGFRKPDGTLNEPYASRYPAYQSFEQATMPGMAHFEKSDGVTDYSAEYWKALKDNTLHDGAAAMHETLAEIARLKYEGGKPEHRKLGEVNGTPVYFRTSKAKLDPKWNALYKAVDANWKRRSK